MNTKFGETADGKTVDLYTLKAASGVEVQVMTYGATIVSIKTPDRDGQFENVVLGLDTFDDYEKGHPALGTTIGRFANRIADGGFTIDGKRYDLQSCNRQGVQIHGGATGWGNQVWDAEIKQDSPDPTVVFSIKSPDGHEGFPGEVSAFATFKLFEQDGETALSIAYMAMTDKPTHVNMTNHAYFNLAGAGNGDVLEHVVTIDADEYLEVDKRQVPTGKILSVEGTAFDFREPHAIGERIKQTGGGYDHCFALWTDEAPDASGDVVKVVDPKSGRTLAVSTTQPGVQMYTANGLSDRHSWKGKPYGKHHGVCFETQHFPDTPNKPNFPTTLLQSGDFYYEMAVFRFGVEK